MNDFDIEDFLEEEGASAPSDTIEIIKQKTRELIEVSKSIDFLEDSLKKAKSDLHRIRTQELPDLLLEVGIPNMDLDGYKVSLKDKVFGTLPKDENERIDAIKYLSEIGGEELIKTDVKLQFGKKEHNIAIHTVEYLKDQGFAPDISSGVHHMSLCAFVREKLKKKEEFDPQRIGVTVEKMVEIKKQKEE